MSEKQKKVNVICYYQDEDLIIPWDCPSCKFKGEWTRTPRKPSLLHRIIQKIKGIFK